MSGDGKIELAHYEFMNINLDSMIPVIIYRRDLKVRFYVYSESTLSFRNAEKSVGRFLAKRKRITPNHAHDFPPEVDILVRVNGTVVGVNVPTHKQLERSRKIQIRREAFLTKRKEQLKSLNPKKA